MLPIPAEVSKAWHGERHLVPQELCYDSHRRLCAAKDRNMGYCRRTVLKQMGLAACGSVWAFRCGQARELAAPLAFGFSLYGMKSVPLPRALKACAEIGYSGVELACMKDWPCDPDVLSREDRDRLRKQLAEYAIDLPCLMDNLTLVVPEEEAPTEPDAT